ncbi:MAG: AsmA family protein [Marivibrio sp.]|uniref:AsmA family protein n=1 Tax=Marivibrio sp. TaxID=2039719 RepID=UPI0032EDB858
MRRAWKILIGVLAVLVVIAGGGLAYVLNIDPNAYKADIEAAVMEETGRQLTINGPIELDIGTETRVAVSDVTFANADWGSQPAMASVDQLEAVVRLIPTIFGTPDVVRVRLSGVDVLVETNADGVSNTAFKPAGAPDETGEHADEGREIEAPRGGPITIPILRDVLIEDITAIVRNAQAGTENTFRLTRLSLQGEGAEAPLSLALDAALDDLPMTMAGTLGSPAAMQDASTPWEVDVTGDLVGVKVALTGAIMEPTAGRGFDLAFEAAAEELADLAAKFGVDAPQVGGFTASLALKGDSDGDLAAEDVAIDVGGPELIRLLVTGEIASATKVAGLDLAIGVEGEEIGNLSVLADRFAGHTIPDLGPFKIDARVTGGMARGIAVTGLDAAMGDVGTILLAAKGGIADAMNAAGVDISIDARSNQIGALSAIAESYTGQGVPALGPLDLSARLVGDLPMAGRPGKLAINDLDFGLGAEDLIRVTAAGEVADLMAQSGVAVDLTAKAVEVGNLDALAQTYTGGEGVPALGPLDLSMRIQGSSSDGLGVQNLALDFGRADTVKVTAQGSIDNALKGAGADLSFAVVSPDLGVLSQAVGGGVPSIGPVDVTGAIKAGANEPVTLEPFTAKIGDSDLAGSVIADLTGAVPKITAKLSSQRFDTVDVTGEGGGSAQGAGDASAGQASGGAETGDGRVIPDDPLPLAALQSLDADIRYNAKQLLLQGSEFDNFQLAAALTGGRFSIDTLTADVGGGKLDGTIVLDGSTTPAPLAIDLTGDKLDLGALGGAAGLKDKLEGPLDLRIDLKGAGDSPRQIAASLDGSFSAVVVDSRVRRKAVEDAMGSNMARLADVLFGNEGEWVVVNCAVVDYGATSGLMEAKGVFVDTDVSTVTGDGAIDLNTEELAMGIKPQTGVISIPLLLTGTLASPRVIPDPDPAKALLSVGGALLTGGGLTAALAIMSASLPEDHPCMASAEAAQQEAQSSDSESVQDQIKQAPEKALEGAGDAVKGVTDGLKNLFGN